MGDMYTSSTPPLSCPSPNTHFFPPPTCVFFPLTHLHVPPPQTKLLAEPWDIGSYQVGTFPNWDRWSEWNGKYRDDVRAFIKGDPGKKPAFATRVAGSADLYNTNKRCVLFLGVCV